MNNLHYTAPEVSFSKRVIKDSALFAFILLGISIYGAFNYDFLLVLSFSSVLMTIILFRNVNRNQYYVRELKLINNKMTVEWTNWNSHFQNEFDLHELEMDVKPLFAKTRMFKIKVLYKGKTLFDICQSKFWTENKLKELVKSKYGQEKIKFLF